MKFTILFLKNSSCLILLLNCLFTGNKGRLNFNLQNYSTEAEVLNAIDRVRYRGENTNTTGGLKVARLKVFGDGYQQRPNIDRIIILITDGIPSKSYDADKLDEEVDALRSMGVRILGVGVTEQVSQSQSVIMGHYHNRNLYFCHSKVGLL